MQRRFQGDFFGVGGKPWEEVTWEDFSLEEFIMGEENFHDGGAGFSSIIKQKNENINKRKVFSTGSMDQH